MQNRPTLIAVVAAAATCAAVIAGSDLPGTAGPADDRSVVLHGGDPRFDMLILSSAARREVAAGVIAGRWTVPEAAALIRAINHLPGGPGVRVLIAAPHGTAEADLLCGQVLDRAREVVLDRGGAAAGAAAGVAAIERLDRQVREATDETGRTRLRPAPAEDMADVLDRGYRLAITSRHGVGAAADVVAVE